MFLPPLLSPQRGHFLGGVPRINPAHPAAAMLEAAYLFGQGAPISLLPGCGPLSVKSGTPALANGPRGPYADYNGSSGYQATSNLSGDVSIVIVGMRGITAGSAGSTSMVQVLLTTLVPTVSAGSWSGFEIEFGNDWEANRNRAYVQIYPSGAASVTGPNAIWLDGVKDSTGSRSTATDLSNGVWYCLGTTISGLVAGNSVLTFGQFDDASYYLTGGEAVAFICRGILPDEVMADLTAAPAALLLWPDDDLLGFLRSAADALVALTGISTTSSAGTLSAGLTGSASGSSATSAAGTLAAALAKATTGSASTGSAGTATSGVGYAASGSAATSSAGTTAAGLGTSPSGAAGSADAGTITSAIGMALTGISRTMSAGSLAYTIGFLLTGAASTAAGGTVGSSGGDTTQNRALTGIHMTALPGNVRVTGGTRWTPQAPRAETIPAALGNTLQPPPRATGNAVADLQALTQWANTLYDQMVKAYNIIGRVLDHEDRIANLERE